MPPRASLARVALVAAALSAVPLTLSADPAWAQQQRTRRPAPQTSRAPAKASADSTKTVVVCDSTAAPVTRRTAVASRPHKPRPRRVVAAQAAAPVKRPLAVAYGKRRPRPRVAAGHPITTDPAARKAPPRCRSMQLAATPPQPGAVAQLVSALPWTATAEESEFPLLTAPTLGELTEDSGVRGGIMLASLLGAGALWFSDHGSGPPAVEVIPPGGEFPPPPETLPPVTTTPEPATLLLFASGAAAIGGVRARRKRA